MRADMHRELSPATSLAPATRTSSTNGTGIDLQFSEAAEAEFIVGTITDGTHTPKIQESDDNSTYTDVAGGDQIGTLTALASNTIQRVAYIGRKRYIRAVVTVSGATSGGVYAAVVQRGHRRHVGGQAV
jgi:hypothetical protein